MRASPPTSASQHAAKATKPRSTHRAPVPVAGSDVSSKAQAAAIAADEQQLQECREKYRFLGQRLRADIRFLFRSLPETVELPPDVAQQCTWADCIADMERAVGSLAPPASGGEFDLSLDNIVALMNFRDQLICSMCTGLLFQTAVLAAEVQGEEGAGNKSQAVANKTHGAPRGGLASSAGNRGLMADLAEQVRRLRATTGRLPEKYQLSSLPVASEPGYFSYDSAKAKTSPSTGDGARSELQQRLLTMLREILSLEKSIRHAKFGEHVNVPVLDEHSTTKEVGTDQLRSEITAWFDRYTTMEHESQMRKALQHSSLEGQLEQLKTRCEEKNQENGKCSQRVHKLEGDVNQTKLEFHAIRREKMELSEKNTKMVNEHGPELDRIDSEIEAAREEVDRLNADAEMLSAMFRLHVEENQRCRGSRDGTVRQLTEARKELKRQRESDKFKEAELVKKETLYKRTVEARESILIDYSNQKDEIKEVELRMQEQQARWQEQKSRLEASDEIVRKLHEELREAHAEIDALEREKGFCMRNFRSLTGDNYNMLLEQFKAERPDAERPVEVVE